MINSALDLNSPEKSFSKNHSKNSVKVLDIDFKFGGINEDIVEAYHWHLNFPYYTGKGYTAFKLEDYHYFSENSQYGANMRQMKGGSIRAFQENLQQLIQIIKVHLIPLLTEIKQADFYKSWFDKITENDKLLQEELKKNSESSSNKDKLEKLRKERNEALNFLKDKWVNEVDNGKLWQMNASAQERGLDFALLPQLFMGINLDDPFQTRRTLKEQLDDDIYSIEITETAKSAVANFMYRFYTWLPTAVKDTNVTYKLKISSLKQFYAQIQMYIGFMKPLLIEISKKSEGFEKDNFYRDFDAENPEFANLFDYSYSFIRILGVRNFAKKNRGHWDLKDLEFTKFGLYLPTGREISMGKYKGKKGFITNEITENGVKVYEFYPSDKKNINKEEFEKLKDKKVLVNKVDLMTYPILEYEISQRRRGEVVQTQQGPQQVPYMTNGIKYIGYVWNIFEVACYRERLKEDNLKLLETFIEEIKIIKDDLLYYVNDLEVDKKNPSNQTEGKSKEEKKENNSNNNSNESNLYSQLLLGPFKAIGSIFPIFAMDFKFISTKKAKSESSSSSKDPHLVVKLQIAEDLWKVYTVYKKSHGYMMY